MGWEGRDPFPSDAITTLGNNQAASLLLLSFEKVSNTKDLLNETRQGILLASGTGISPNFPYFCICGSSGWANVMARPWKAGNDPKIGNGSVFVLFG